MVSPFLLGMLTQPRFWKRRKMLEKQLSLLVDVLVRFGEEWPKQTYLLLKVQPLM